MGGIGFEEPGPVVYWAGDHSDGEDRTYGYCTCGWESFHYKSWYNARDAINKHLQGHADESRRQPTVQN